jgi:8-oxo-dGTP pyrophosphatase MutT (NUDIX family)
MGRLSTSQKERLADIIRLPLVASLLGLVVKVLATRHRAGVALVCFNHERQVLLLRHVFHPATTWDLPGGWLEKDESPADCILRELREETGFTAELGPIVDVTRESTPSHIAITYAALLNGSPVEPLLSYEILEAQWFAPDRLPGAIRPSTQIAVDTALEQLPSWYSMERLTDV